MYIYIYTYICVYVGVCLEFNQQNGEFYHHQITRDRNIGSGLACDAIFGLVFDAGLGLTKI